jgi:nicotinate-nucleotide pyrophosphorylase (carboxylating)
LRTDGDCLEKGTRVLEIEGPARSILVGERSALNFLQHLSGIATETKRYVDAVAGTQTRILDTRKTTPGLRHLEKYAVQCGGGTNHRFGLYDQFLIKDNHLALMGGRDQIAAAIRQARDFEPELKLEVEADTLEQVAMLAELGVDVILLDNMTNEQMTEAVKIVAGRAKTEASGNMSLTRVPGVAACGVDFISVGALTHSVRAVDFSLEMIA